MGRRFTLISQDLKIPNLDEPEKPKIATIMKNLKCKKRRLGDFTDMEILLLLYNYLLCLPISISISPLSPYPLWLHPLKIERVFNILTTEPTETSEFH
jgi:hypothetical protein